MVAAGSDDAGGETGSELLEGPADPGGREASVNKPLYVSCERVLSRNVRIVTAESCVSARFEPR
jgi:hypothetical protein